ncbi:hypothetical protein DRO97_01745 [Archaeoglobales archaeon]|nr:MAG: hypothetical protein DRO97_01745 [Archaeoglobales archaeon]
MITADWIDKRADVAAVLSNNVRRQIRDLLRHSDPLTLTEIAKSIHQSEPNTYKHLNKMLKAKIVVKKTEKINGRLVTLYTLSDYYNELFAKTEQKPDITPLYLLLVVYTVPTLLLLLNPKLIMPLYNFFGVKNPLTAMALNLVGLVTTSIIVFVFTLPYVVGVLRQKIKFDKIKIKS